MSVPRCLMWNQRISAVFRPNNFTQWSDLNSCNRCNHVGCNALKPKNVHEVQWEREEGREIQSCHSVTLQHYGSERRERQIGGSKWASVGKRKEGVRYDCTKGWAVEGCKGRRARKKKEGSKEGREMLVLCSRDGASGVVEILQQRASPLLSNVHLILKILGKKQTKINYHYYYYYYCY